MKVNSKALELIKEFEGLRLEAYQDSVGVWTIGYGTTSRAGIGVTVGPGMKISQSEAERYLQDALDKFGEKILPGFTRQPTPDQYGAMISLAYNIGPTAFLKSTCLRRFNAGDIEGAADALTWFNKAGGQVLRGLVRRREAEAALMLGADTTAPTPRPDAPRSSVLQSTELRAQAGQVMTGVGAAATGISMLDGWAQVAAIVVGGLVICLALYAMRRRVARWVG